MLCYQWCYQSSHENAEKKRHIHERTYRNNKAIDSKISNSIFNPWFMNDFFNSMKSISISYV